ncbi:MAG: wax ester/triacylglycerol synthase family O-acyltransferase [Novosphingobium sp.]
MRQLAMADAVFVLTEQPRRNTNHIGMVFVFDPSTAKVPVTFERVLELYQRRLPLARAFREKMVRVPMDLDYPYWVNDKDFDLEFHVRHTGLPRPGTRQQFFAVLNRVMSLELDMSRPLWETYFIEGLDAIDGIPPGSFALLCKMHHAAVDGVSGMEMITALLESDEAAAARMPKGEWKGEDTPDQRNLLLKAIGSGLTGPLKLTGALLKAVPEIADNRRREREGELIKPPKAKAPKTRFNAPVTAHRVHEGRSYPFAEIKRVKDAVDQATINDVVLAVVGGSMRRYLESKGELPAESLVASVPISVRTSEQAGTGGNQLTMTFVPLGTDIADPLERLTTVGAAMRQIKEYNKAADAESLAAATQAMPGMLLGLAMRGATRLPHSDRMIVANTMVSNVPGPQVPMTMLGASYVAGFGSGPAQDGLGLFHIVTSLSGVLSIGFNACRELMPDPEFYGQCLADSFEELRAATAPAANPKAADPNAKGPKAKGPKAAKTAAKDPTSGGQPVAAKTPSSRKSAGGRAPA